MRIPTKNKNSFQYNVNFSFSAASATGQQNVNIYKIRSVNSPALENQIERIRIQPSISECNTSLEFRIIKFRV